LGEDQDCQFTRVSRPQKMLGNPGSFASASFDFGGSYASGPSSGAGGSPTKPAAQRPDDKQTCVPVTVRLLEGALESRTGDSELRVHGQEASQFLLVGLVEDLVKTPNSFEFTLNDASGRLKVRHYFTAAPDVLNDVQACRYAGIVGSLRTSPVVHFGASWLWPVTSADEVSYHAIEVAHAALKLRQGERREAMMQTPEPKRVVTGELSPPKVDQLTGMGTMQVEQPAETSSDKPIILDGEALKSAVRELVRRSGEGKEEGVSIIEIFGVFPAVPTERVREAAAALVDDGEIYNTTDDDHFQVL